MTPPAADLLTPRLLPNVPPRGEVDPSAFDPELADAIEHATGTDDPVYAPIPSPDMLVGLDVGEAGANWLPTGHHFDMHVEHRPLENAGSWTGGGNKWLWHITVAPWFTVDSMYQVLAGKRAAPHLLIGGRPGVGHPILMQLMPFNVAGRALEHVYAPETNRADCIQVEICANVADVEKWKADSQHYKVLANLVRFVNNVMGDAHEVPRKFARHFDNTNRFGAQQFVDVSGHCGHMHVPGNDHTDPTTTFRCHNIFDLIEKMPHGGYNLPLKGWQA